MVKTLFGLLAMYLIENHRLSEWLELLNWNEIRALAILIVNTLSLYLWLRAPFERDYGGTIQKMAMLLNSCRS